MAAVRPYFPELGELRSALVEIEYRALYVQQVIEERRPLNASPRRDVLEDLGAICGAASEQNERLMWAQVSERLERISDRVRGFEASLGLEQTPALALVPGEEASD